MGFTNTSGAAATVVKAKRCGSAESDRPLKRVKLVPSDMLQASLVFVVKYNTKRFCVHARLKFVSRLYIPLPPLSRNEHSSVALHYVSVVRLCLSC
jgi:hypothetical protein